VGSKVYFVSFGFFNKFSIYFAKKFSDFFECHNRARAQLRLFCIHFRRRYLSEYKHASLIGYCSYIKSYTRHR